MPGIFDDGRDDYMFPTTVHGMAQAGIVLESAQIPHLGDGDEPILESAVQKDSDSRARANAMCAVLSWIEDGDFTYDSMDENVMILAGVAGEDGATEDDEDDYNNVWRHVPDAMLTLGADIADVREFVDGPGKNADEAAARVGKGLAEEMNSIEADDDDLIATFSLGEDAILESAASNPAWKGVLEATYKRRKVIRDGKVQVVNKRISGKVRLSSAQKASVKKMLRKAHSATANLHRKKSMKKREKMGL